MNNHCRVLLVDDEPANLLALDAMLGGLGCTLVHASSGSAALRSLLNHDFALVLLDLQMPTMDGMEVARLIRSREQSRDVPIMFVTASDASHELIDEAYSIGAVDYLTKPVNPAVLRAKVRVFVDLYLKNAQLARAQRELHASDMRLRDERIRLILDNTRDYAFITTDVAGRITEWDGAAQDITGWSEAEVLGRDIALLFTPEDLEGGRPEKEREGALRDGRAPDKRWHMRKDGERFYADGVIVALRDDEGQVHGLAKIFQDATERMRGELQRELLLREVQAANARLEQVFQQAPAFLCTLTGPDHVFEMANERYFQLVGKDEAIIGQAARTALPEVEGHGFFELLDNVYRTGEPFVGNSLTMRLRQDDGSHAMRVMDFVYLPLRDPDGVITGILVHGVDLTERTRLEEAYRAADERYRILIDSMDEAYCLFEVEFDEQDRPVDYRFLETNPVFEQQTGLVDAAGKSIRELVPNIDTHWIDIYGRIATTGESMRFIDESKALGRWFDVYATRLGGPESRKVAALINDVTARRQADEDLRRLAAELSEASRRKSEFLAVLAHELRNPLAPIRTGLDLMRTSADQPATMLRIRDVIDRQVSHMVHLVDDLLDVARITTGKIELKTRRVDLREIVNGAVEASQPAIQAGQHVLTTELPDEVLALDADPVRMTQVIANLLANAAKYTPNGGRIALDVHRQGAGVRIRVRDNGVGIPSESLTSVFNIFSQVGRNMQRAQGGLGIGLSIARQLVELHGGRIEAASAGEGQGSSFEIDLPLAVDVLPAQQPRESIPTPAAAGEAALRIVVADDNEDAAHMLGALLEIRGHTVHIANDGAAALECVRECRPDLVFLDIGMPGMTGYEVAQAIRASADLKDATLVALTGWGAEEDRERTREAGFDHHLTKPAAIEAVDAVLRKAPARAAP